MADNVREREAPPESGEGEGALAGRSAWLAGGHDLVIAVLAIFFVSLAVVFLVASLGSGEFVLELLGEERKREALKVLGFAMGGVLLVLNAVVLHRRARAAERAAEVLAEGMRRRAESGEDPERGLVRRRLGNAVEHLGHTSPAVRMGAAHQLFRLAEDVPELRHKALDMLCAHIRQTTGEAEYWKRFDMKPSAEIQELLTLLFVEDHTLFSGLRIDLRESWLNGADLEEGRLWGANLRHAHLERAILSDARLDRAFLTEAHLTGAWMRGASLREANICLANMQECSLQEAQLQGVAGFGGLLTAATLSEAQLQGASLPGADLSGAILARAEMQGAKLSSADLRDTILDDLNLRGAGETEWSSRNSFAERMRMSAGKNSDLSTVAFRGEMLRECVEEVVGGGLAEDRNNGSSRGPAKNGGKWSGHGLPEGASVVVGRYTHEDAERWIAEHERAMSEVPEVPAADVRWEPDDE